MRSDHRLTGRIVAELKLARSKLERALSPRSKLFPAVRALLRIEQRLNRPLRVAICGEYNSGKSSLANLLGGIESLPTAAVSNTRIPTLLYYAPEAEIWAVRDANGQQARVRADRNTLPQSVFRLEVGLPSQRLRALQILDFPGLAGPGPVNLACHAVDAALWCTVSPQAWKESERVAWNDIPARLRAYSLLVATHADLLTNRWDHKKVLTRLHQECDSMFRDIVMVSTIDASGADALDTALASLIVSARDRRANSALRVIGRITRRALSQMP